MIKISIHALCEEGDTHANAYYTDEVLFQSTPSVKRATMQLGRTGTGSEFQSTPSVKRATIGFISEHKTLGGISIHALCEEGDLSMVLL